MGKRSKEKKKGLIEHIDINLKDFRSILALLEWGQSEMGSFLPERLAGEVDRLWQKFQHVENLVEEKITEDPMLDPPRQQELQLEDGKPEDEEGNELDGVEVLEVLEGVEA